MTIQDNLLNGSNAFADAEEAASDIVESFRTTLASAIDGIKDEGKIGALEAEALKGRADALATNFKADLYALHEHLKNRCVDIGIDDQLPALRDGGPR